MSEKKSVVFLTTSTSGTGSFWRIIERLATSAGYKCEKVVEKLWLEGKVSEISSWAPEEFGHVYLFNQPSFWIPKDIPVDFIFNFRDPRDLVCNQYAWVFSHPDPSKTEEQLKELRDSVREKGIDQFVLEKDLSSTFVNLVHQMEICKDKKTERSLYLSYAGLCLDFENAFKQIVSFFGVKVSFSDFVYMSKNSVENLTDNGSYIRNLWVGADIAPGRFLNELSDDTINKITLQYSELNSQLSSFDRFGYSSLHLLSDKERYFSVLNGRYKDSLFNRTSSGQFVLLGKDSNLFLRYDSNAVLEQTAGFYDYSPLSAYSTAMVHASREMFLHKHYNASYFHCLIPNKETALSKFLPSSFFEWQSGTTPIERYRKEGMDLCWKPFFSPDSLSQLPGCGFPVKTDTHWDHEGALTYLRSFLSSDSRLKQLKQALDDLPLKRIEATQQGDLGSKLNVDKEPIKIFAPESSSARLVYWNQVQNEGSIRFFKSPKGVKKIFVLHDSFSLWIMHFLAELCSEVVFLHTPNFDPSFFSEIDFHPDFVFFFQAERFFVRPPLNGVSFEDFIRREELEKLGESVFSSSVFKQNFIA